MSVQAQTLAVKHFSTSPVAAACVAFLEMLGEDTSVLRVRLHAARLVRAHHTAEVTGSAEQRQRAEGQIEKSIGEMGLPDYIGKSTPSTGYPLAILFSLIL